MEDSSFLSNISNRPKSYGNNKFQIQIQEANSKIDKLNNNISDKENELDLFKKNMTSFHIQLQEKNSENVVLCQDLEKYKSKLEKLENEFQKFKLDKEQDDLSHNNEYLCICEENMNLKTTIDNLHSSQDTLNEKYNTLKTKYQTTFDLLEKKNTEYNLLQETNYKLNNELNLLKDLNLTQENEINILKQKLIQSEQDTTLLKSQIFQKDVSIGELHKKLSLEKYRIRGKITEHQEQIDTVKENTENTLEHNETTEVVTQSIPRPTKLTTQRGVKLSRR
jgi:chromosome segregation ATPase